MDFRIPESRGVFAPCSKEDIDYLAYIARLLAAREKRSKKISSSSESDHEKVPSI